MFPTLGPRPFLTTLVCGRCGRAAQKTETDQDGQIAQTIVKCLIDRTGAAGGHTLSTFGFVMALQQNAFDMIWDSNKFWTD